MSVFTALWKDESGQALVEYGTIIGLVVVGAIVALTAFGGEIKRVLEAIAAKLKTVPS